MIASKEICQAVDKNQKSKLKVMILKQKNETQTKICIYNQSELKVRIEIGFTNA